MRVISKRGRAFNSYGRKARDYESARQDRPQWKKEAQTVEIMLADVRGRVLDCPVGTGRFLALYERLGLECVGVDVDSFMLSEARNKRTAATLIRRDGRDTGQDSRSFDAVVCMRLFEHCTRADARDLLREFWRVLKPHGVLIASVQLYQEEGAITESYWRRLFGAIGFETRQEVPLFTLKTRRRILILAQRTPQ